MFPSRLLFQDFLEWESLPLKPLPVYISGQWEILATKT